MSDFKRGEIVDAVIKGVRVHQQHPNGTVTVLGEHGHYYPLPPQAAITRVAPAEWPPQHGDVWRAHNGTPWFARSYEDSRITLVPADGGFSERVPAEILEQVGPLILVYRPEVDETPDDPECQVLGSIHCADPDCSCKTDDGEDL